ncbi:MAG: 3-oxoacyl-ACP synthase [Treponema sp.]|nr:3-oxoacyl-ACP synthase [Treponema sp.]
MNVYLSEPAVLCGAGNNSETLWEAVTQGNQRGIKKVTALNGKEFYAARIDDQYLQTKSSSKYDMRIMRIEEACLLQLEKTIEKAKEKYPSKRIGVCVGSCDNGTEFSLKGHRSYFEKGNFEADYSLEIQGADYVSTFISKKYDLQGPCLTFSTACSSSAGAIIKAAELLKSGICDAVIAGGVDIASDTVLMGFDSLEAVSSEITNPFSKNRHGITLGEGAAFFLMSKESFSEKNVRLLGYGESADAYHMTSPDPSGQGAVKAIKGALSSCGLEAKDIDYVNLHGTGTRFNDSMEAKALDQIFGDYKVPCSTTKAVTGHTLGAAGALEAAVSYLTLGKNSLPLQVWDKEADPELPAINIVSEKVSLEKKVKICMSNSFAFGGANSCLILGIGNEGAIPSI